MCNDPQLREGDREAARLRHEAQDTLALFERAFPQEIGEHDQDGSGAGVSALDEVGVPALLGDRQTRLEHELVDDGLELLGRVVTEKGVYRARARSALTYQLDVLVNA